MPKRTLFIDARDEFFVDDDGNLIHCNDNGEESPLVVESNVDEFIGWLTDERDTFTTRAKEAEKP